MQDGFCFGAGVTWRFVGLEVGFWEGSCGLRWLVGTKRTVVAGRRKLFRKGG